MYMDSKFRYGGYEGMHNLPAEYGFNGGSR
jgi:hypothetical protein